MAVAKGNNVYHLTSAGDAITGSLVVVGVSYHGAATAGHAAIMSETTTTVELFHMVVGTSKADRFMGFAEGLPVEGITLGTLDSGEVHLFVK